MMQFDKMKAEQIFSEAEKLFHEHRFNDAFSLFKEIIEIKEIDSKRDPFHQE